MILVDLDKQKIIQQEDADLNFAGDSQEFASNLANVLPENVVKCLKVDLYNLINSSKTVSEKHKNMLLCKVFLKLFVKTLGNYKNYLISIEPPELSNSNNKNLIKKNFMVIIYIS